MENILIYLLIILCIGLIIALAVYMKRYNKERENAENTMLERQRLYNDNQRIIKELSLIQYTSNKTDETLKECIDNLRISNEKVLNLENDIRVIRETHSSTLDEWERLLQKISDLEILNKKLEKKLTRKGTKWKKRSEKPDIIPEYDPLKEINNLTIKK